MWSSETFFYCDIKEKQKKKKKKKEKMKKRGRKKIEKHKNLDTLLYPSILFWLRVPLPRDHFSIESTIRKTVFSPKILI